MTNKKEDENEDVGQGGGGGEESSTTSRSNTSSRIVHVGVTDDDLCNNRVVTAKYSLWTFFPVAILEQFRRTANKFFLCMIIILAIGEYSTYFESAYTPWTLLGPLLIVIAVSLAQEGYTDFQRHRSDYQSNTHPCTVVAARNDDDNPSDSSNNNNGGGNNTNNNNTTAEGAEDNNNSSNHYTFEDVQRQSIQVGQLVLLRNRDMIPADIVLLALSGENGGAYVETSGIDGETNLKLRQSAKPKEGTITTKTNHHHSSQQTPPSSPRKTKLGGGGEISISPATSPTRYMTPQLSTSFEDPEETLDDDDPGDNKKKKSNGAGNNTGFDVSSSPRGERRKLSPPNLSEDVVDEEAKEGTKEDNVGGASDAFQAAKGASMIASNSDNDNDMKQLTMSHPSISNTSAPPSLINRRERTTGTIPSSPSPSPSPVRRNRFGSGNGGGGGLDETGSNSTTSRSSSPRLNVRQSRSSSCSTPEGALRHGNSLRMSKMPFKPPKPSTESLDEAMERIGAFSGFGVDEEGNPSFVSTGSSIASKQRRQSSFKGGGGASSIDHTTISKDIATVTVEPPNASVHTFSGKLVIPSTTSMNNKKDDETQNSIIIPLNAEHLLLRGAVLRNTDWALGVVVYSGKDTKIVRNSNPAPSKLSRLDELVNRTVAIMIGLMVAIVLALSIGSLIYQSWYFPLGWYLGYKEVDQTKVNSPPPWPYLQNLPPPEWRTEIPNFLQMMVFFTTLLGNFVPLTIYVAIEMTTRLLMVYIYWDKDMYHDETDTPAMARSTTITDLGQVKYIFSDKTGTLTQNVMRYQRCAVDGMLFGSPIVMGNEKDHHHSHNNNNLDNNDTDAVIVPPQAFHPLRALLKNCAGLPLSPDSNDNGGIDSNKKSSTKMAGDSSPLTFNTEMFLRVMSICHTVVVEKETEQAPSTDASNHNKNNEYQQNEQYDAEKTVRHINGNGNSTNNSNQQHHERNEEDGAPHGQSYQAESPDEGALVSAASLEYGFQFIGRDATGIELQCSTPSLLANPTIVKKLKTQQWTPRQLANITTTNSNNEEDNDEWQKIIQQQQKSNTKQQGNSGSRRKEKWQILAVNKFDSARKRMSVLVRSPPELGNLLMVLCKGADSAMLQSNVCELLGEQTEGEQDESMLQMEAHLGQFASEGLRTLVLGTRIVDETWGRQWLREFEEAASSIKDRDTKLTKVAMELESNLHIVGVTAIEDKLQKGVPDTIANLAQAGIKLWVLTGDKRETAIEIGYSTKVLTEQMSLTQITSHGGVNEDDGSDVIDAPTAVRTCLANEFIRLVKYGCLPDYQTAALQQEDKLKKRDHCRQIWSNVYCILQSFFCCPCHIMTKLMKCLFFKKTDDDNNNNEMNETNNNNTHKGFQTHGNRRVVRERAEELIKQSKERKDTAKQKQISGNHNNNQNGTTSPKRVRSTSAGSETASPFERARSAQASLLKIRGSYSLDEDHPHNNSKSLNVTELRNLALAASLQDNDNLKHVGTATEEDLLSLKSFVPGAYSTTLNDSGNGDQQQAIYDKKRRTLMEKWFAVDRDVRHGRLAKHVPRDKRVDGTNVVVLTTTTNEEDKGVSSSFQLQQQHPHMHSESIHIDMDEGNNAMDNAQEGTGVTKTPSFRSSITSTKALIIEGAALIHLLDDPIYSEMLFGVASQCNAVIACRVSPQQKALLVRLVRTYDGHLQSNKSEPITLAIGDGANDVGMIQEAHVGIGISGLEGQQAVNSSDFSIAQFRYLETLLLIHGRWNFNRLSRVVLFTFYKNAILAGLLIVYAGDNLFSGTPLFDQWLVGMFNFVTQVPILFVGFFDREISSKEYIRNNPELYKAGPDSEDMSIRKVLRWLSLTFVHFLMIYFFSMPLLNYGGTMTSAWTGLMQFPNVSNQNEWPGDGEGDYTTFGTAVFTIMVFVTAYKALYETKSIYNGQCPTCTCCSKDNNSCWSRLSWTWIGILFGQIFFFIWAAFMYQLTAERTMVPDFVQFIGVATHTFGTRAVVWLTVFFVPVLTQSLDVVVRMFGNIFFPTQTQIHAERAVMLQAEQYKQERKPTKTNRKPTKTELPR